MVKNILLTAGAAVVVVGGGAAAVAHHNDYQNKQHKAQATVAEQAKKAQASADQALINSLQKTASTAQAECQKGVDAYAKLPLSVQRVTPKPVCSGDTTSQ